jgi:hypothetical protein
VVNSLGNFAKVIGGEAMTMSECCDMVLRECPDGYAKAYARAWLDGSVSKRAVQYGVSERVAMQTQARYILNGITRWRGANAMAVRESLKRIAGGVT